MLQHRSRKLLACLLLIVTFAVSAGMAQDHASHDTSAGQDETTGVRIELDEENGRADIHIRGEHFTTYHFNEEVRIPFLWPVHAEGGVTITRNWPDGSDEPGSTDHPHHRSIWTAFGDVNGYDHWHDESIVTKDIEVITGENEGVIRARNVWVDDNGMPVLSELREYRFHDLPASERIFDQSVTFRADYGEVAFGDYKEGMFAFRIRPEIQGDRAGLLTNANGEQGEAAVYGTPVPWMDYSGSVDGLGRRGIALFSHPDNFRLPAWHVRDYGLAACNFFAMQDVAGREEEGTYTLSEGGELTLRVRYYIHSGDVDEAEVAEQYRKYADTP